MTDSNHPTLFNTPMLAECVHPDCDRIIDLAPQGNLPNGKRPSPTHYRGMCMKCRMAERRKTKLNHTFVCANPDCRKTFKAHDPDRSCCSPTCARIVASRSRIGNLQHCKRPGCNNTIPRGAKRTRRYCTDVCMAAALAEMPTRKAGRQRSALRLAIESGDYQTIIAAVQDMVTVDSNGCWIWLGRMNSNGYPSTALADGKGKTANFFIHRLVVEAKHGQPLGTQDVHHMCANTRCCSPDHLQPVTHRENMAEMLARKSLLARIAELEDVVRHMDANHPILNRIECA